MKTTELKEAFDMLITDKLNELRDKLKYLKSDNCELSKNTKSTQIFQRNRELKTLNLIKALINNNVTEKEKDTLVSLVTLTGERQLNTVDFDEGDLLMDILNKYQDVKRISDKIEKVCEKKGLKIDYSKNGLIVKA